MPALITHHLFGEESIDRLPQGVIPASDEERIAFILGNQARPVFFHILTPRVPTVRCWRRSCIARACLASSRACATACRICCRATASLGRAFALGLLSHYVLDRNAHPFVYEQQFGIVESDSELEDSSSQVHAVIESDLDVLMLCSLSAMALRSTIAAGGRDRHHRSHQSRGRRADELCCRTRVRH